MRNLKIIVSHGEKSGLDLFRTFKSPPTLLLNEDVVEARNSYLPLWRVLQKALHPLPHEGEGRGEGDIKQHLTLLSHPNLFPKYGGKSTFTTTSFEKTKGALVAM